MKWIKKRENQIFFSVTLITILVAISPILTRYCLIGHDSDYHILRIEALARQIKMGLPYLKVNPTFFGGAGYASSMFYPDFLLYMPAILRALGAPIKFSYHTFMVVCIVLCYAVSYICAKKMTNNRYIGILFAVILTLSSYHLDDILVRAAVGEYTAFIFVPIVLYGVYNLCYEDMKKPWILGLGMGLVLLCHTLTFVMCFIMVCIMLVFNFAVFVKTPKLLLKLSVTGIVTLAATAFYWLPVAEQFMTTRFYVSTSWIEPAQEAVKFSSIFGFKFPTLGISLLLLFIPRVLLFRNEDDSVMKYSDHCFVAGIVFAVLATDIVPWSILGKYFAMVQFPWRLYVISTVLISFADAVIIFRVTGSLFLGVSDTPKEYDNEYKVINDDGLINRYGIVLALVISLLIISTLYTFSNQKREYYDYSNDYFDYKPFTASVIAGEWLPEAVKDSTTLVDDSEHAYDNNGNSISFERIKNKVVFNADSSMEYVDVPLIYYKGYGAKCTDGTVLFVDGSGNNGFVRVYTDGYVGEVITKYKGTIAQIIGDLISIIVIISLIIIEYRGYKGKTK